MCGLTVACAMAITAMGENVEGHWQQAGCELARWSNEMINHTSISPEQKKLGITAHQQQFGGTEDLESANEIPIYTWGELTYIYVKKKDRNGKLSPRAARCIWNGRNHDHSHSISGIPIVAADSKWQLQKPIHSARVVVSRGIFPLKQKVNSELPTPKDAEIMTAEEAAEEAETPEEEEE